jgi:hypothetical protein
LSNYPDCILGATKSRTPVLVSIKNLWGSKLDEQGTRVVRRWYDSNDQDSTEKAKVGVAEKVVGNLNRWLNRLIDQALDEPAPDWDAHFRRPRRKFRYTADEIRKAGR